MKVLVATDGSEHSMKAVARALELAEKQGALVTLMSVSYYDRGDLDEMPPFVQDKLEAEAKAALNKAKAVFDAKGIKVETVLVTGLVPANLIIRKAEEGPVPSPEGPALQVLWYLRGVHVAARGVRGPA